MVAQHHDHGIANGRNHAHQSSYKTLATIIQQRFRTDHAAGGAGRQDNTGDHFNSDRSWSWANTDFESDCHSTLGARRVAIISATTEIAISSGVSAPMSRPMGAKIFSNKWRGRPSFSCSFTTAMVLRLLPIMAIYFAGVSTAQRSTRISSRWPRVTIIR